MDDGSMIASARLGSAGLSSDPTDLPIADCPVSSISIPMSPPVFLFFCGSGERKAEPRSTHGPGNRTAIAEVAEGEDVPLKRDASAKVGFKAFLNRVVQNAKAFGDLVLAKTGDKKIDRHLLNLRMIKAAQTYGFLMYLRVGGIDDKQFVNVLKLTEGFVLRRHICRERTNETETLFAKLCTAAPKTPSLKREKATVRRARPTIGSRKTSQPPISQAASIGRVTALRK